MALVGVAFLASVIYMLVLALGGADLVTVDTARAIGFVHERHDALPWVILSLLAGCGALAGWWRATVRARRLAGGEERTREQLERQLRGRDEALQQERQTRRRELEREHQARQADLERERRAREQAVAEERRALERELDEQRRALEAEREEERRARERLERSRETEQRWTRELQRKVVALHRERGALGHLDDIRQLVLHLATTLVEAEKGLLLARVDEDRDGALDLVASEGFSEDPRHSAVAQRFATEVLERDAMVREDDRADVDAEKRTTADEEIENLVAIPVYIRDEFSGVVVCANRDGGFAEIDDEVLLSLGDHAGAVLENSRLHGDLRSAYLATVSVLAEAIEAKDPLLGGHSASVSRYVAAMAGKIGLEGRRREELIFGSLLHDVGKIGISERILLKPATLTDEERSVVQLHPRIGFRLLQQVPALRPIAPAVLHHHERYDGGGYPAGLRGEQIPVEARIVSVVDSFSAMTGRRPYREAMTVEEACQELQRCAGTQFDPEVVRLFVEEVRRHPPTAEDEPDRAIDDPELELRRDGEGPLFGSRAFGVVDSLTLLYSHRYFHEVAEAEAQRAALQRRPFCIVMVELDVAPLNATDGYAAGDDAILEAARAVQRTAGACDGVPCRISGRRLALVLPQEQREQAVAMVRAQLGDLGGRLRTRFGQAEWEVGDSGDDVIQRARRSIGPAELAEA